MMRQLVLTASLAVAIAFAAPQTALSGNADTYRQLDLLMEVFERVRAEYVEEVEDEEVLEAAINGMLASLDPHSSYLGPDNFKAMQVQTRGEYGGLGLEVSMEKGVVKVVSPIDDTPAAKAGLQTNDYITHIDGDPIMGRSLNDAVEDMRGPVGTTIVITVVREGVDDPFDVELVRDKITLSSVAHRIERDSIGYVRIRTFNEQTTRGVKDAIRELRAELGEDLDGIVLDLRNNPGGLLDESIAVSDIFLDKGEVVSTRGRHARDTKRWHATPGDLLDGLPVIVLVNAGSASASEIVAGALQDHRRATVLGDDTFGKGTVQTIIPLGADSALRLTTARYYTPSGRSIQELGIEPDIPVKQVALTASGQVRKPRRERDLIGHLRNEQLVDEILADQPAEPGEEVTDEEGNVIERSEPERIAGGETGEDSEPIDYQLNYALDLLEGIDSVVARQQSASVDPARQSGEN